jgi:hypothetical protein
MTRPASEVRVLLDNEFVSLRFHVQPRIVHHEFKRFVPSTQFRKVLESGLDVFKRSAAHKWLSDNRGNTAIPPEDSRWAMTVWAPRAIEAGWKFWAVVLPQNVIGQMNMRRRLDTFADKGVTAEVFTSADEGLRWLEAQSVHL